MTILVLLFILSILLALTFVSLLIIGLFQKKRKLVYWSLVPMILSLPCLIFAGTQVFVLGKAYVDESLKQRSGNEIYANLFYEKPECVVVKESQDQVIPKIDYAIWLHVSTCPIEVNRIAKIKKTDFVKVQTINMSAQKPSAGNNWFTPELMGESILILNTLNEYHNGQIIYCSLDSAEMYIKDIFD